MLTNTDLNLNSFTDIARCRKKGTSSWCHQTFAVREGVGFCSEVHNLNKSGWWLICCSCARKQFWIGRWSLSWILSRYSQVVSALIQMILGICTYGRTSFIQKVEVFRTREFSWCFTGYFLNMCSEDEVAVIHVCLGLWKLKGVVKACIL